MRKSIQMKEQVFCLTENSSFERQHSKPDSWEYLLLGTSSHTKEKLELTLTVYKKEDELSSPVITFSSFADNKRVGIFGALKFVWQKMR